MNIFSYIKNNIMNYEIYKDSFLDETLTKAWFEPQKDNFELLKKEMRPILDDYIELHLYALLGESDKKEYDHLVNKNLDFFDKKIINLDTILSDLYINWQKEYLENFRD